MGGQGQGGVCERGRAAGGSGEVCACSSCGRVRCVFVRGIAVLSVCGEEEDAGGGGG